MGTKFNRLKFEASLYRESYFEYFKSFWNLISAEKLCLNWHIEYLCNELQIIAERVFVGKHKEYDLIVNCPPGESKSSIFSILFPTWVWTRMPSARFICGSYSERLALDLSRKARDVILSEKYQELFPEIKLREDQSTKCLAVGSQILMADGGLQTIETLQPGDKVQAKYHNDIFEDEVIAVVDNGLARTYRIDLSDGSYVCATDKHRFYGWDKWIRVGDLKIGDPLCVIGNNDFRAGRTYLSVDDAFLISLWIAEGTKGCTGFRVTNETPEIEIRLRKAAKQNGWGVTKKEKNLSLTMNGCKRNDNPSSFLRRFGFADSQGKGTASTYTIRIPQEIMEAPLYILEEFLGTYIACDGCVYSNGVFICTSSEMLAYDFQILLKRFNIQSVVNSRIPIFTYKGKKKKGKRAWRVNISDRTSILKLEKLNIYGKNQKLISLITNKKAKVGRKGAVRMVPPQWRDALKKQLKGSQIGKDGWATQPFANSVAKDQQCKDLQNKLEGKMEWRKIIKIEEVGVKQVYDLQTKNEHCFFVNGILSHNSYYVNTQGGMRYSVGVGGSVIGIHAHFLIPDDPIDPQAALSDIELENSNIWLSETLYQRKVDSLLSPTCMVMQRLHQNDPTGNWLERGGNLKHICLPAENTAEIKPPILAKYYRNGLLDPERLSREALADKLNRLFEVGYAGQYLQQPTPRGGFIFKVDMIQLAKEPPIKWKTGPVRYWDKAATKGGGCFTVGVKMAIDIKDRVWILDMDRFQLDSGARELRILRIAEQDGKSVRIGIEQEPAGSGKESVEKAVSELSMHGYFAQADRVTGDKTVRADTFSVQVNRGNVIMVEAPWNKAYLDELRFFPNSKFKDITDASSGGFGQLSKKRLIIGALR